MKKKVLRAAAIVCALLLTCTGSVGVLAEETSGQTGESTTGTTASTTTTKAAATQTPSAEDLADDLSLHDPYTLYCENDSYAMSFSEKGMFLRITDKKTGENWYSTPPGVWSSLPAVNKPERMSLITVTYTDKSGNENYAYSYTKSVNKDAAKMTPIKEGGKTVGARIVFDFPAECFTVPVEIRLTDLGFDFDVCYDEIVAKPFSDLGITYEVTKVAIMPFFGAQPKGTDGYMIIPDGSGAMVDFQHDNGSIICDYNQVVYGRDTSKAIKAKTNFKEQLMFPLYGIKSGSSAVTAIVTKGDARTELFYRVPGVKSSYNNIYFNFIYRDGDTVTAKDKSWDAKTFKVFEDYDLTGEDYVVSYRFSSGDKANYVGMAEQYRNYLTQEKGMKTQAEADYAPLNVELIGSIRRPVSVLGFPINKVVPMTSYKDVLTINSTLQDKGVNQILLDYKNWYSGSADQKIPANISTEGALGSEKDFREMSAALEKTNTRLFGNIDLVSIRTNGNGYNKKYDSTRSMDKQPAMTYSFAPDTFQAYTTDTDSRKVTYLLSPFFFEDVSKKFAASYAKKDYGLYGISDSQLCNTSYSDYGKKQVERLESAADVEKALSTLAGVTGKLMLNKPNGYTLPYATYVGSTPIQSSDYYTFTRDVPFYQLVIQGVVNNSTTILNDEADMNYEFLKAVETGSAVKVRWLAQNMKMVDTTQYDYLINSDWNLWVDDIAKEYSEVAPLLRKVSDQTITAHTYLEENVTQTTFANGVTVIVNYNPYDVTVGAQIVKANSYAEGRA